MKASICSGPLDNQGYQLHRLIPGWISFTLQWPCCRPTAASDVTLSGDKPGEHVHRAVIRGSNLVVLPGCSTHRERQKPSS